MVWVIATGSKVRETHWFAPRDSEHVRFELYLLPPRHLDHLTTQNTGKDLLPRVVHVYVQKGELLYRTGSDRLNLRDQHGQLSWSILLGVSQTPLTYEERLLKPFSVLAGKQSADKR